MTAIRFIIFCLFLFCVTPMLGVDFSFNSSSGNVNTSASISNNPLSNTSNNTSNNVSSSQQSSNSQQDAEIIKKMFENATYDNFQEEKEMKFIESEYLAPRGQVHDN